jgi:acetyl-CoA acetyltransferase family protein
MEEGAMAEPIILEAVRTPIGRRNGVFRQTRPDALLAMALDEVVARAGLEPARVEDVVVGCVTQAGEQGANIGRQAVLLAGYPVTVPATTLDRMCGSSQQAIHFAAQAVAAGDMRYVLAAGVESMTRAPMFSNIGGGFETLNPDLLARHELIHQGESAERIAERYGLSRRAVDEYAVQSHLRAAAAMRDGRLTGQIVPTEGISAEGAPLRVDADEGVRPAPDLERMLQLPTVFRPAGNGVVTAGNASQISDGAAAVLLADRDVAEADGFRPRARFRARVAIGDDPTMQLLGVIPATHMALERAGLAIGDVDVIEINEAFACVVLAWEHAVRPDMERVNPNGGAIAHGHPLGATGAILFTKLLHELERRDSQFGLQVMCIGHGMATATVVERLR